MPENPLIFKDAEKVRDEITKKQLDEIITLYNSWADDIGKMAEKYALKELKIKPAEVEEKEIVTEEKTGEPSRMVFLN